MGTIDNIKQNRHNHGLSRQNCNETPEEEITNRQLSNTTEATPMYFEQWGSLLSKGNFYGVFNVLNVPTTCVLNTLLMTQQRGVHNVALSPQAEQRYTLETL